jgi:NAD-specific glutamate dehydrogenase
VVRHDDDDPYLASPRIRHSDVLTSPTQSRSSMALADDAFASGGSAGYDHKKMGIIARARGVRQAPFP